MDQMLMLYHIFVISISCQCSFRCFACMLIVDTAEMGYIEFYLEKELIYRNTFSFIGLHPLTRGLAPICDL